MPRYVAVIANSYDDGFIMRQHLQQKIIEHEEKIDFEAETDELARVAGKQLISERQSQVGQRGGPWTVPRSLLAVTLKRISLTLPVATEMKTVSL